MKVFCLVTAGLLALVTTASAQPVITAGSVTNGASYLPGIAPGSIFIAKGSGLGPATLLQAPSLPFQTTLSNTSVTFTPVAGGAPIEALMVYTWDKQIAAMLPSTAAPGDYNVTVTYNGATSAPEPATVVARNFGFVTQASSGAGPAQATYGGYDLNRFTTGTVAFAGHNWSLHPAVVGNKLILWGTGAGADIKSDTTGGSSGDQTAAGAFVLNIDGIDVKPDYLGRSSGSPGLDQANFTIPAGVTPGCFKNVQIRGTGFTSNLGTIAIAGAGQKACSAPTLTQSQLAKLDLGGTLTIGTLTLLKNSLELTVPTLGTIQSKSESASGSFAKYTVDTVGTANFSLTEIGACYVYQRTGTSQQIIQGVPPTPLNAGNHLTLNGPNASNVAMPMLAGANDFYSASLYSNGFNGIGGSGTPTLTTGTYTIAGTGGTDVGAFSASVNFPGDLTWTNEDTLPDPIPRSSGLTVNWTGGTSGLVAIAGTAFAQSGGTQQNPIYNASLFTCIAQATAGTFTVPVSVLSHLFQVSNDSSSGSYGSLSVFGVIDPTQGQFTAPLTAGGSIDRGFFAYSVGATKTTGWN
ncbi:MAG: hypothetical protein LAP39_21230 [Acidobacteriia bacterium]|nr:hypothetical protein [Terriglobia bacterium]